jgi:hypothetical protein
MRQEVLVNCKINQLHQLEYFDGLWRLTKKITNIQLSNPCSVQANSEKLGQKANLKMKNALTTNSQPDVTQHGARTKPNISPKISNRLCY